MANEQPGIAPIIVIKKKGGHGGHHGGAWKVAYADFVTAMMALFIVLWLMSSSTKATQEQIAGYFNDPKGTATKHGSTKEGGPDKSQPKKEELLTLKQALQHAIQKVSELNKLKGQIEITITEEGLRIELLEDKKGTFFETGSAQPTPILVELLKVVASKLGEIPNKVSIEGHTDSQPYAKETTYGNWELSADRANVARRLMQANGVRPDQISQVRGFADQRLRKPDHPMDASNRRVSLIVQYMDSADAPNMKGIPVAGPPGAKGEAGDVGEPKGAPASKGGGESPAKTEEAPAADSVHATPGGSAKPAPGEPAKQSAVPAGKPSPATPAAKPPTEE